jgi:hypothetical protein
VNPNVSTNRDELSVSNQVLDCDQCFLGCSDTSLDTLRSIENCNSDAVKEVFSIPASPQSLFSTSLDQLQPKTSIASFEMTNDSKLHASFEDGLYHQVTCSLSLH